MNTGGPASEKTLQDEFAGQALAGLLACPVGSGRAVENAASAYDHASAMLAEKARREAVGKQSLTADDAGKIAELQEAMQKPGVVECVSALCRDHSGDASKMVPAHSSVAGTMLRRLAADVLPADIQDAANDEPLGWCAEQVRAHVNTLTERNRELVEAFGRFFDYVSRVNGVAVFQEPLFAEMRTILAKHKGVA